MSANRLGLDGMPECELSTTIAAVNRVGGRVQSNPSATMLDSIVHGPLAISEGAVVENSFIGPYTAIGPHAVLSGVEIDNSMVLTKAEIRRLGSRLEGCIIGEGTRIARSFDVPRGLHLRLPSGSDLRIS